MIIKCIALILLLTYPASSTTQTEDAMPNHRIDVGASFIYGWQFLHSYGGAAEITSGWKVWNTVHATGMLNCGILAGYQIEPVAQPYSPVAGIAFGAAHRIEGFLTLGTSVYLPPNRRLLLGIDLFGGWSHVVMRGSLSKGKYNLPGDYRADKGVLASGGIVELGYRVTDYITIISRVIGPLPYAPSEVTTYAMASLGIMVRVK